MQTGDATHAICQDSAGREVICYVGSKRLNLKEWERHTVRVSGTKIEMPGWKKPLIMANGIVEE